MLSLGLYWYATVGQVCAAPLTYYFDPTVDARFGLSTSTIITALTNAEQAWETAAGRELFIPVTEQAGADVVIQFVFDERHEYFLAESSLRESLEDTQQTSAGLQATYEATVADYKVRTEAHSKRIEAYDANLAAYNDTVASYNEAGGAPDDVFAELEKRRQALDREAALITAAGDELEELATTINTLGQKGDEVIRDYNADVTAYNSEFGEPDEFTQGDYQDGQIHIYTFTDTDELTLVLAHEFGHALDLPHVEDKAAVMYYLLEDQPTPLQLTPADIATLLTTCGETGRFGTSVRALINRYII